MYARQVVDLVLVPPASFSRVPCGGVAAAAAAADYSSTEYVPTEPTVCRWTWRRLELHPGDSRAYGHDAGHGVSERLAQSQPGTRCSYLVSSARSRGAEIDRDII